MGLYRDRNVDLYMVFINLEKVYDRVLRGVLWRCFEKKGMSPVYIRVIKDMYEGGKTRVRTAGGVIDDFCVGIGLHQGLSLIHI